MADQNPFELRDQAGDIFALRDAEELLAADEAEVHVFGSQEHSFVCDTERRGYATPHNKSPIELMIEATEGFIPLWDKDVTLRWRFQERSLARYRNPEAVKQVVRDLMRDALRAWGPAVPVRFSEQAEAWDFEISIREADRCRPNGCTLASAFFPDQGQHELVIYPLMFTLERGEQMETLAHELGHVFGLRHFFAQTREQEWAAVLFGEHNELSIMNYGDKSQLTETDKSDLIRLYQLVWSDALTNINGTPIRKMKPFSSNRL